MFGKGYSLYTFVTVCCLAISAKSDTHGSITRFSVSLDLNVDEVKSHYHIGLLSFTYDADDLKVHRSEDSNSVELLLTKARLLVLQGKTRSPSRPKYDFGPKGVLLLLEAKGTAQLSTDGNRVENCQFIFAENKDSKVNQVEEVTKKALFQVLPYHLAQELCDNINEYHSNKINSLD